MPRTARNEQEEAEEAEERRRGGRAMAEQPLEQTFGRAWYRAGGGVSGRGAEEGMCGDSLQSSTASS